MAGGAARVSESYVTSPAKPEAALGSERAFGGLFGKYGKKGRIKKRTMPNRSNLGVRADSLTLGSLCLYFTYWIVNRFSSFVRDVANDVQRLAGASSAGTRGPPGRRWC